MATSPDQCRDDIFIIAGSIIGNTPALDINGLIQGGVGRDEVRLVAGGVVSSIDFGSFTAGNLSLQAVETITLDGGRVTGAINASGVTTAITFNLTSGTITGGITGGGAADSFVIGVGITIGGTLDGGMGANTLSLATGFTLDSADLFNNVLTLALTGGGSLTLTLANIEDIDIAGLVRRTALTFSATAGDDAFAITTDLTGSPVMPLVSVIDGLEGQDELQLNAGAVVASVSFNAAPPTNGAVHLQRIETITLDGGTVNGAINASGATTTGVTFDLRSGVAGSGDITGSGRDDIFIIAGSIIGNTPALDINGLIQGGVGRDEVRLVAGGVVSSIDFGSFTAGNLSLQAVETITLDGGRVTGAINASGVTTAITFNLTSGTITGGITGGGAADSFVIGVGITIGGTLDGGMGANTLSLATGFTLDSADLFNNVLTLALTGGGSLTLTLANIEDIDIAVLVRRTALTFSATAENDTFAISSDLTSSPVMPLVSVIDGLEGQDELQLNAGAVVASVSFNAAPPTNGAVHLQRIETITLDGGTVNGAINASGATTTGVTFDLRSGVAGSGDITGSGRDDIFIIAGSIIGNTPALDINGLIQGGVGRDEVRLVAGGVVSSIDFGSFTAGNLSLQAVETITLDGGTVNGNIDISGATTAITFNLTSGTITGGVTGTSRADSFVIGAGITIGSTIDGGMGANTLSLHPDFTLDSADLFNNVLTLALTGGGSLTLTLANIEDIDIAVLVRRTALTFSATGGDDTFAISSDLTSSPVMPLVSVIDGLEGQDELQLNAGAVVAGVSFSDQAPTEGAVHLQSIETITLDGGRVNGTIDASAAPVGVTFALRSGRVGRTNTPLGCNDCFTITGSDHNDVFIISGDITGDSPALNIGGISGGDGDQDEVRLVAGGVVDRIYFFNIFAEPRGPIFLRGIEVITIDGGRTTNESIAGVAVSAGSAPAGVTFNLRSGTISNNVHGSDHNDIFIISGDITGNNPALDINGVILGRGGRDEARLIAGAVVSAIDFGRFTAGELVLIDVETITIDGGTVNGNIDISGAPTGRRFDLTSGTIGGDVLGSNFNDTFNLSSAIRINGHLDGAGGDMDRFVWGAGLTATGVTVTGTATAPVFDLAVGPSVSDPINFEIFVLDGGAIGSYTGDDNANILELLTGSVTGNINAGGGNDRVTVTGGVAFGDASTIDGDTGTDILVWGAGLTATGVTISGTGIQITGGPSTLPTPTNFENFALDGGAVNGNIDASTATQSVSFDLVSGTITGDVTGTSMVDSFVIGAGITVGGTIDGSDGMDTLSLATGFTPTSANLFGGVLTLTFGGGSLSLTLANIEDIDIAGLVKRTALTFSATAENDAFAISSDITGGSPAMPLVSVIDGLEGQDELQLNAGAVVTSVAFSDQAPIGGAVNLQNVETITLNGGRVNGNIDISGVTTAITFNLTSGTITGGVTGTSMADSFVIGADITIGGTIDGGGGMDALSLHPSFTPASANLFNNVLTLALTGGGNLILTLANIATANIDLGSLTLTMEMPVPLTFSATAGNDTFAISNDITDPAQSSLVSVIDGGGGTDVLELNAGAVVASVSFNAAPPTRGCSAFAKC